VWGSDWAFWTERSVSEQIAALRELQIPEAHREEWGYPEITPAVRDGLLGGNAARLFGLVESDATVGVD
jgi:predicted TIM-barrel fold metal-dependent hydrolase